ncbi:MAG: hypothetical protein K0Q87_5554 [Neobacillus sp.]|nr:hypothetical protein [Neobacillus sp.]
MHKSAAVTDEQNFASNLNQCLGEKQWTPTMLYVQSNVLSADGREVFSPRSLQKWLSGKGLPKIESTVAMAEALDMPELIMKRVELEIAKFRQIKSPARQMQTIGN